MLNPLEGLQQRRCTVILVYKTAIFEKDDRETHETLLQMIVELYLTMRGYSYASTWMEKFKIRYKGVHPALNKLT